MYLYKEKVVDLEESLILKKKQTLRNNEYYEMQEVFDGLYKMSKDNKIFVNLMKYITDKQNIMLAYRNIKKNKGSTTAGTDNKNINNLKTMSKHKLIKFITNKFDNYTPKSVRRVEIPKQNGKLRPLGIPCIDDRIIQQCIKQVLEPICEAKFHKHSYGFRPNRSTSHAIARCMTLMNKSKLHYVVDIDIKGFFDNVNHSKLKKQIKAVQKKSNSKEVCNFTPNGRTLVHTKLKSYETLLSHLLNNFHLDESIEYFDNKISLMVGQQGRCYVTGKYLEIDKMECHHKVPKNLGGTDEYKNLVWLITEIHNIIHSTKLDDINKYLNIVKLDKEGLGKVNSLGKLVGNSVI